MVVDRIAEVGKLLLSDAGFVTIYCRHVREQGGRLPGQVRGRKCRQRDRKQCGQCLPWDRRSMEHCCHLPRLQR